MGFWIPFLASAAGGIVSSLSQSSPKRKTVLGLSTSFTPLKEEYAKSIQAAFPKNLAAQHISKMKKTLQLQRQSFEQTSGRYIDSERLQSGLGGLLSTARNRFATVPQGMMGLQQAKRTHFLNQADQVANYAALSHPITALQVAADLSNSENRQSKQAGIGASIGGALQLAAMLSMSGKK